VTVTEKKESHLSQLDGIRGLAILLVALGHIFYRFYIFKFGWIGLNLFFILSGYLITSKLFYHLKTNARNYFKNFYARRFLRIFPLYYGCLIFFFIILPLFYSDYTKYFSSIYNNQIWYWLYASNWSLILFGLPKNPVFFHFWSLAVEEQFYLFWPILFKYINIFKHRIITIGIIILFSIYTRVANPVSDHAYYNTLTACEPLMLGCLVSILEEKIKLRSLCKYFFFLALLSVLALSFIFYHNNDLHISNRWLMKYGYSAINLIWVYLLCILLLPLKISPILVKIFSSKPIAWLGKYSYGIYIFHWLILQLFIYKYDTEFVDHGMSLNTSYFIVRLIGIFVILICSYCSYHLYEKHFLNLKKYFV